MTRVAIVADMHANIYSADALLRHLDSIGGVDWILNLGDFVQIGPNPAEVADLVLTDPKFVNIRGNNEWSLIERHPDEFPPDEVTHQDWTIAQLGPERLQRIAELPPALTLTIGGIEMAMKHEPPDELADLTLHKQDMVHDDPADPCAGWMLFGHTHRRACLRRGNSLCINPGSLGCSKAHSASFCVAEFDSDGARLTFERIAYDVAPLIDDFHSRKVPDRDHIIPGFYGIGGAR